MELGDCIQETISISPSSDIDADWYHVFSQKLISHDFIETEPYHWETSFIFTVEEKRAIKTPAERALRQAIVLAGQRSLHMTLQMGDFQPYQVITKDIIKAGCLYLPRPYRVRFELLEAQENGEEYSSPLYRRYSSR
ncbi:hypothetical protein [Photobacterium damselae]|uniref:hypothetical protein n=1 Tax=Photobacterium damselae TaxID=38293 RepID=UPI0030F45275